MRKKVLMTGDILGDSITNFVKSELESYTEEIIPIYNFHKDMPTIGGTATTKGDLKRCVKGIHNRKDGICIHCKKEFDKPIERTF